MNIFTILYVSLVVFILYLLFTIGFPFLMALLVALLIEPVIVFISKLIRGKRKFVSFIVCTLLLFLVIGSGYLLSIKGVTEAISLSKTFVQYTKDHSEELTDYGWKALDFIVPITEDLNLDINDFVKGGIDSIQTVVIGISEALINMLQGIPNLIVDTLIFVISLYIISMTLPNIKSNIINLFDESSHHKIEHVMEKLYKAIFGFITAQLIISFFIFSITIMGLLILKLEYVLALAGLVTLIDILPLFGAGSVLVSLSIFYAFQGNYYLTFGLLILYGAVFAFRRIVEPKVLGDAIGIGTLSALSSMYIGFKVVGFIGLILGPAIVILINALISSDILKIKIKV